MAVGTWWIGDCTAAAAVAAKKVHHVSAGKRLTNVFQCADETCEYIMRDRIEIADFAPFPMGQSPYVATVFAVDDGRV